MLSRRECGELLAQADSLPSLAAITRALGFVEDPDPLDRRTRRELGISDDCRRAWIQKRRGSGGGTLRALILDLPNDRPLRNCLTRLSRRLNSRRSPLLWFLCGTARDARHVALAAIDQAASPARVRALVAACDRVTDSDAETLAALSAGANGDDVATYTRWLEVLGRESVTRRFYAAVARHVQQFADCALGRADMQTRRELALLNVTRLLFLAFLESKGWLDGDRAYLSQRFADCMLGGGSFHERVLLPLFFGTLSTPVSRRAPAARALGRIPFLNGGLFARTPSEKAAKLRFPDDAIGAFLDEVLTRYRFTAHEESTEWSESAIDPEMLGKAFESLMGDTLRRGSGTYFTPQSLVSHVADSALRYALARDDGEMEQVSALLRGETVPNDTEQARWRSRLSAVRVVDPACGSGAFLVHLLERIVMLHSALGDGRAVDQLRRAVLATSIFGVDVNPTAVWLCELRLWLSCVIESKECDVLRIQPLPNLDRNIRVGDSLLGEGFEQNPAASVSSGPLRKLRLRYVRATGRRKGTLARELDRELRRHFTAAVQRELAVITARRRALVMAVRGHDLFGRRRGALNAEAQQLSRDRARALELRLRLRSIAASRSLPFSFATDFADVQERGGFDIVLGNPPWVRSHNLGPALREALRQRYATLRDATWKRGAELAGAKSAFGGQPDLAVAFLERGLALLNGSGTLAFLVPTKLWKSLAGGGVRRHLLERSLVRCVEDWSDAPSVFDAAVYPSLVVVQRGSTPSGAVSLSVHRRDLAIRWCSDSASLAFDSSNGSPWLLLPAGPRSAFDRLLRSGVPLHNCGIGRVTLGVKTGCNAAFIVGRDGDRLEPSLLRPLLRGEDVLPWVCGPHRHSIIWTHGRDGRPLERLPPLANMHLTPFRGALQQRSDGRGARWWSLFRTEGSRGDTARVVWPDLARTPRAAVLRAGDATVPLNTCYVLRCRDDIDAFTVAALLNSPIAAAWLGALAEPARGGYRRLFAWTVASFPVPDDWARARDVLGSLGARAMDGHVPSAADLFEAACQSYRLRPASVAALCDWMPLP